MEGLRDNLIKAGIHPSYHRLRILEYLSTHFTHPTVDMIHRDMTREIPTLSKTTIYNTLDLFLKKLLVMALTIDENEVRYDINIEPHGHFKCMLCGNVYDVNVDLSVYRKKSIDGHKVKDCQVYFTGICKDCISEKK